MHPRQWRNPVIEAPDKATALWVERLNIRLPAGFERRADSIARQLGRQLRELSLGNLQDRELQQLTVPGVTAAAGETDSVIARRIASAIQRQLVSEVAAPVVNPANQRAVTQPGGATFDTTASGTTIPGTVTGDTHAG